MQHTHREWLAYMYGQEVCMARERLLAVRAATDEYVRSLLHNQARFWAREARRTLEDIKRAAS